MTKHPPREIHAQGRHFRVADDPAYSSLWGEVTDGIWEPETFAVLESFIKPRTEFVERYTWPRETWRGAGLFMKPALISTQTYG